MNLSHLPVDDQIAILSDFGHRKADTVIAYILSLCFLQYAYVNRPGMTLIAWVVTIATFGIGGVVWFIIDLFRIPGIVARHNDREMVQVMRDWEYRRG